MTSLKRTGGVSWLSLAPFLLVVQVASGGTLDSAAPVQEFYQVLVNTMRSGPALGQSGRYAKLAPAVRQAFDILHGQAGRRTGLSDSR